MLSTEGHRRLGQALNTIFRGRDQIGYAGIFAFSRQLDSFIVNKLINYSANNWINYSTNMFLQHNNWNIGRNTSFNIAEILLDYKDYLNIPL